MAAQIRTPVHRWIPDLQQGVCSKRWEANRPPKLRNLGKGPLRLLLLFWLCLWAVVPANAAESLCAEVKIVIAQKLSLERQAFDAHMVITNGLDSSALEHVRIDLTFLDSNKEPVLATGDPNGIGASFFYRTDTVTGIPALDGSANIAAKSEADIHWLILPAPGTGGTDPKGKLYYVGAKVTYTLNGQTTTVDVTPDYIVVSPQPLLKLDYFLPSDVYADDSFTPAIEPPVPFTLGVRVQNIGAGPANKTVIESAQPKIVENERGLLVNFQILGGYVDDQPAGKSLLLDFGNIAPSSAKVGRWNMVTTLSGRFLEFDASYTHADSLGGALTSLLSSVTTHTLVHDVKVDLPNRDSVRDFLAKDADTLRLYESEGVENTVTDQSAGARFAPSGSSYTLTFPATAGFVFAQLNDPFAGTRTPVSVVRSDGKVLPPENFWLYKTRGSNLAWSYYLNLFDAGSTGSYTVTFTASTTASLSGVVYSDQNGNGVRESGESGIGALTVNLKGTDTQGSSVSATAYTDTDGQFAFANLNPGTYNLSVGALDGLVDGVVLPGTGGGTAGAGQVSNIALVAGASAQGYVFAKRSGTPSTGASADLSVSLSASSLKPAKGDSVTFNLTAANAGPSAVTDAVVTLTLPDGLTDSGGTTGTGSYTAGSWNIGALAAGQSATLAVAAKVGAAGGALTTIARIGSAVSDPGTANNVASVTLQVDAGSFSVNQNVRDELRVLSLVSCPAASGDAAACEQSKSNALSEWLQSQGCEARATTTLGEFRTAVRSGRYNAVWLSGGADKLTTELMEEVRALVRRGGAVLVEGRPDTRVDELADLLGTTIAKSELGQNQSLTLLDSKAVIATVGGDWALVPTSALELARFANDGAITLNSYGRGRALTLGFDAAATLADPASGPALGAFLKTALDTVTPHLADPALARGLVPIATVITNTGTRSGEARVVMTLADAMRYAEATPAPDSVSGQQLTWNLTLAASEKRTIRLTAQLPDGSGAVTVHTRAINTADDSTISEPAQTFSVEGADTVGPRVRAELAALTGSTADEARLIAHANDALQTAQTAFGAADYEAAIVNSVGAETTLRALNANARAAERALAAAETDPARLDLAGYIALAEDRWVDDGPNTPTYLVAAGGAPQTAVIGEGFAEPLSVAVRDAQDRPVAGLLVTFTAPMTGASAAFPDSAAVATAVTGPDGIAVAQQLTANTTVGSYEVVASAAGVSAGAAFTLTNLAVPQLPGSLIAVGGDSQSARIGSDFAQPLQARLLDTKGQPMAGVAVNFALPASGASATFAGGTAAIVVPTDADGVATTPALTANGQVGSYTAIASAAGGFVNTGFALANLALPQVASRVVPVSGGDQSALVNSPFAQPLQVQVLDASGAPVAGVAVAFMTPLSGASATFEANATSVVVQTGSDGMAISPTMTANGTAGSYAVTATAAGVAERAAFALTNLEPHQGPASVVAVSGSDQTAPLGTRFSKELKAKVLDAGGRPMAGAAVTFALPATGPSATFANGAISMVVQTDAEGIADTPPLAANLIPGRYDALATVSGVQQPAIFTLTNTVEPLTLAAVTGTGQKAQVLTEFTRPLRVRVTDTHHHPKVGMTVRFTLPATGASALFPGGVTEIDVVTDNGGVAVTPALTANAEVGSYLVVATAPGADQPVSFELKNFTKKFAGVTPMQGGGVVASVDGGGADCGFDLDATRLLPAEPVSLPSKKVVFPHGLFTYALSDCTPGATVTITTQWPELKGVNGYLKFGPTPSAPNEKRWYVPDNLKIDGNVVSYTVTDGGLGDDDLKADGMIHDPGGPVIATADVPTLAAVASALLSGLLLLVGGALLRRTRA